MTTQAEILDYLREQRLFLRPGVTLADVLEHWRMLTKERKPANAEALCAAGLVVRLPAEERKATPF